MSKVCVMSAVFRTKSNLKAKGVAQSSVSLVTKWEAPSLRASAFLEGECEMTVTSAPRAEAKRTAKWPRPPRPTMATFLPAPTFARVRGDHTVSPGGWLVRGDWWGKRGGGGETNLRTSWGRRCGRG